MTTDKKLKRKQNLSTAALLLVAIILGSGYVVAQYLLDLGFSYAAILLAQFAIATLIIGVVFFRALRQEMKPWMLKGGFIIGTILFAALFVQTVGLDLSTPSNNAFILSSNVVIVPFMWWIVAKQRPGKIMFVASALSLVGLGILSMDFSAGFSLGVGDLMSFSAAVLLAAQIVATGVLTEKMDYRVVVFLQFAGATFWALVVFFLTGGVAGVPDILGGGHTGGILMALFYMGAFNTALCFFLQTLAQRFVSSAKAAILLATESLFGTLFSLIIGYDVLNWQMVVGGAVICVSVVLPELVHSGGKAPGAEQAKP